MQCKRLILCTALLLSTACGGGGSSSSGDGFLGTFRGTLFLNNNTCTRTVADSGEATFVINSDATRTVVTETFLGGERTYIGQALTAQETTLRVVDQDQGECVFVSSNRPTGETYQELFSLEFTLTETGELMVARQLLSPAACSEPECITSRVGTATRVETE